MAASKLDPKRVLVAMSGGVDSSVTAALLKNQGYDVIGVHMTLWDHSGANKERFEGRCCSLIDSNDARRVCDKIDAPYYVINAQEVFQDKIVDYFVHEYIQNRTPNPCAHCNSDIKFNYLFQKADELGCYWIATGHYSQVIQDKAANLARLVKAVDANKDQTYFLFGLTQPALKRTLMPLGALSKSQVRKLAEEFELGVAEKADSQEICFIGSEGYKGFIEKRVPAEFRPAGDIKSHEGVVLGMHDGLHRFTIGQRKGLDLKGKDTDDLFVIAMNKGDNSVIVGPEAYLFQTELMASQVNWIQPVDQLNTLKCKARIRSRHEDAACKVTIFENNTVHVEFDKPQRAITPGQAIVFYQESEVLGGGFIDKVGKIFATAKVAEEPKEEKEKDKKNAKPAATPPKEVST